MSDVVLKAPGTGQEFTVSEENADYWRRLGYTDSKPTKKAAASKSSSSSSKK